MNMNLKPLALALVASFILTVCADDPACAPKANAPAPAEEPAAAAASPTAKSELAPAVKQAKPRRARRVKKDKSATSADGQRKSTRRRRTRKMDSAEIPVTGMLDSAE